MNLRSVDLNLLVILDVLLDEAHVSRAAARLGLSQPAASNALDRCRVLFEDRLLERHGAAMRLTPIAEDLAPRIRSALAEVRAVLRPQNINASDLDATVRIASADQPAASLLPELYARISATSPGIRLVIQPWQGGSAPIDRLKQGDCDLAFSVIASTDGEVASQHVGEARYVIVMRAEHPATKAFGLESWLSWPHVLVSSDGTLATPLDGTLARRGLRRRIGLILPSFLMVPDVLRETDLIAALPHSCISPDDAQFRSFEPPIEVEGFPLHLAWHKRQAGNPAVQHVASLITSMMRRGLA